MDKIRGVLGSHDAAATIHGGTDRDERLKVQERFAQDKDVLVLVATDAAGEGINLQCAHLLVNYDLPWNPNRLEQRFGRIHRIGQTEVCHMWNMAARNTREGDVYLHLLLKLENERKALGGQVFDVLGKLFEDMRLKDLLMEAVRYGDQPGVKARLLQKVESAFDEERIRKLIEERSLAAGILDKSKIMKIRGEMERAEARKLQPHFIRTFFVEALKTLGGAVHAGESKRLEVTYVPAVIRGMNTRGNRREPILKKYERICFDKGEIDLFGRVQADFVCPGHPLLDASVDLLILRNQDLLKRGAVLVDESDYPGDIRVLIYLQDELKDSCLDRQGNRRVISRHVHFIELNEKGETRNAGYAPYLDYVPITAEQGQWIRPLLEAPWLKEPLEPKILGYAAEHILPRHKEEVRQYKEEIVRKTVEAVKDRLTREIIYWDRRANELKDQELAGKPNAGINSGKARQRADELQVRLDKRLEELENERRISSAPPLVIGCALVVPKPIIDALSGAAAPQITTISPDERARIARLAMAKVMQVEKANNRIPRDVSKENPGYDIESSAGNGKLMFIEVKGRSKGTDTVTVSKNEILTCLNKPGDYFLAIVIVDGDNVGEPVYIRSPFSIEPDFGVTSINYNIKELLAKQKPTRETHERREKR